MTRHWTSILGYSATEIRRLVAQARIVRPVTERLLRAAGIASGMRVLDIGCGVGDASLLAADLVGPAGSVIGIDWRWDLIAVARKRAGDKRFRHVTFKSVPLEALSASFDAVIGRYVCAHQPDLTRVLRIAAHLARRGAVVALHEGEPPSAPNTGSVTFAPIWRVVGPTLAAACRDTQTSCEAATKLMAHFAAAGLPLQGVFCEMPVSCGEDRAAPWRGEPSYFTDGAVPIDTIERQLRAADAEARRRLECRAQICAWARTLG
jgi:ubiquinone/menaquinone biosynthesis C-methylase UbiE